MIVVILGKSCSGKSTLAKHLSDVHHFTRLKQVTTRPMREDEDGSEYYYLSEEVFRNMEDAGSFIEVTRYPVYGGGEWSYGTLKEDFDDADSDEIKVVVLGVPAFRKILEQRKSTKDLYVVLVKCDDQTLDMRSGVRGGTGDGEYQRRKRIENRLFEDFEKLDYPIDICIDNSSSQQMSVAELGSVVVKDILTQHIGNEIIRSLRERNRFDLLF